MRIHAATNGALAVGLPSGRCAWNRIRLFATLRRTGGSERTGDDADGTETIRGRGREHDEVSKFDLRLVQRLSKRGKNTLHSTVAL